jgi:hypothetical protein
VSELGVEQFHVWYRKIGMEKSAGEGSECHLCGWAGGLYSEIHVLVEDWIIPPNLIYIYTYYVAI